MGSKKLQVWLPLLFSVTMVAGMMIGYQLKSETGGTGFLKGSRDVALEEVLELINKKYVDPVKTDSINDAAIDELLSHLDPHSVYIPPIDVKSVDEELMGNFGGIGVEFQVFNDTINIVRIIAGGPAESAGLKTGDQIIKANDTIQLAGKKLKYEDIKNQLRGPIGSPVQLTIRRDGQLKNIVVKRGMITVPSVEVAYMIAPQTGYLMINKFGERTYEEFMQQMEKLQQQGMQKLILDLRGNGGGLMNEATAIADEFLDGDKLIVYTEGSKSPKMEYRCKKDGIFEKGKLVVLVDETSASASEVLTGALQDWDRATIIGRRTFGKGLVQQQFRLSNGGAVRLTVARYYTPLGRNIQKPYNHGKEKYEEELIDRFHDGELEKLDSSKSKGPAFKTPAGHIVYGGWGITPDYFVAIDTNVNGYLLGRLHMRGGVNRFAFQYFMQNKASLANVRSMSQFDSSFSLNNSDWNRLHTELAKDFVKIELNDLYKKEIVKQVKELVAEQIWGNKGFYFIANKEDGMIEKSMEVLK
ncbi:MAG: S41 family peptidase [Bacteroidota bacterium]|nr:S41 family peptidase [Bacteroidota bacterium]